MRNIIIKTIGINNIYIYTNKKKNLYIQYKTDYIHLTSIILYLNNITIEMIDNYYRIYIKDKFTISNLDTIDTYMRQIYSNYNHILHKYGDIFYIKIPINYRNNHIISNQLNKDIYIKLSDIYSDAYNTHINVCVLI